MNISSMAEAFTAMSKQCTVTCQNNAQPLQNMNYNSKPKYCNNCQNITNLAKRPASAMPFASIQWRLWSTPPLGTIRREKGTKKTWSFQRISSLCFSFETQSIDAHSDRDILTRFVLKYGQHTPTVATIYTIPVSRVVLPEAGNFAGSTNFITLGYDVTSTHTATCI